MFKFRKYLILFLIYLLLNIIISSIYYFSNISYNITSIFIFIINLVYIGIINYLISKTINKKGILLGTINGFVISILFLILSLLFKFKFNYKLFIYYLIIIMLSISTSIISKNIKK